MEHFGDKLRVLRENRGLTIRQLATELGYNSHNHVASIERGERLPATTLVLKIARLFDVPTDWLMKDELELD